MVFQRVTILIQTLCSCGDDMLEEKEIYNREVPRELNLSLTDTNWASLSVSSM
jgi:hypothetical protein